MKNLILILNCLFIQSFYGQFAGDEIPDIDDAYPFVVGPKGSNGSPYEEMIYLVDYKK